MVAPESLCWGERDQPKFHPVIRKWDPAESNLCFECTPYGIIVESVPKRDFFAAAGTGSYSWIFRKKCLFNALVFVKRLWRPDADDKLEFLGSDPVVETGIDMLVSTKLGLPEMHLMTSRLSEEQEIKLF